MLSVGSHWVSKSRTRRGEVGGAHTTGRENGVYEQRRAEAASTGDHVLEKRVFVEEGKEEIFVCEVGFQKSTQQRVIRRDSRPLGRLSRIDVGINHLRNVERRLVQSTIGRHDGRELRRRRPVPLGIEAFAVDERRCVWVAGGPEEVGNVERATQAVVIASLGADRQLEQHVARVDVAHDVFDGDAGADAVQHLEHFCLGTAAKQLVELFVDAAMLLLRVELAPQRLAACLGRVCIVDALGAA